jgi:hypothetical protein
MTIYMVKTTKRTSKKVYSNITSYDSSYLHLHQTARTVPSTTSLLRHVTKQTLNTKITNILLNEHMVTENDKYNLPLCPHLNMETLQMQACFPVEIQDKKSADCEHVLFTTS